MKTNIILGLNEGTPFEELYEEIVQFKNAGGKQEEAQLILSEIRTLFEEDGNKEDMVLNLLDYVTGWCPKGLGIWP